jgi:hypothetical protein
VRAPSLIKHLQHGRVGHRWVLVRRDRWSYALCTLCGRERELLEERFLDSVGDKPPPFYPSAH